ncbi:taurine catabolism dioxygenase [Neofusicoccum parvum]|uniref:Taurine catabolism dioxygenase n=1 Tax=Neofusicoccum parvum TaxID=310453 RepID=A0ACB5SQ11_9PEZI|nr:taurine catabolism dioxygenase [Neofusicoccum parvum]GME51534.1 taurine catabolism dioxygenase [Neofusicoccum parvum]
MSRTASVLLGRTALARRATAFQPAHSSFLRRGFAQETAFPKPLKLQGVLKPLKQFDVTPTVGTEFPEANLVDMMHQPNADELLRDLAITISRRGVVFFRNQNNMNNDFQKKLIQRMGELTAKPKESGLHIHPVLNPQRDLGGDDLHISTISSRQRKASNGKATPRDLGKNRQALESWHSDIQSENVPSDYTCLRLVELPTVGGDTLWASGYEVYDRISKPMRELLEPLTANYTAPFFEKIAKSFKFKFYEDPRGHPDNTGIALKAVHPVIRTNPVTGWKSVFAIGAYPASINGLTPPESEMILQWLMDIAIRNHDLQCRFRWQGPHDMAIWDNRSMIHNATMDYDDHGERFGHRVCGIGEKPYLDPNSKSMREALEEEAKEGLA